MYYSKDEIDTANYSKTARKQMDVIWIDEKEGVSLNPDIASW
jgi:hypothetical protein